MTLNEIWIELELIAGTLVVHPLETTPPREGTWEARVDFELVTNLEPAVSAIAGALALDLAAEQVVEVWLTELELDPDAVVGTWKLSLTARSSS